MEKINYDIFYDKKTNFENINELRLKSNNYEKIIGLNLMLKCSELANSLDYDSRRDTYLRTINSLHVSLGLSNILNDLNTKKSDEIIDLLELEIKKQDFNKKINDHKSPVLYEIVYKFYRNKNLKSLGIEIIDAFNQKNDKLDFRKILSYYDFDLNENKKFKSEIDKIIAKELYKEESIMRIALFNPLQ